MKIIKIGFVLTALAVLGGCMAVPVDPGYAAAPPRYYAPAPVYYPAPVLYGPPVGFGFYGGGHGYRGGHWRR